MEVHYYDSISSTNTTLLEMSKKGAKSWTVIWTDNQTRGRGYAGQEWVSENGKNLAVSILIISRLNYKELIFLNQWICNCLCTYLANLVPDVYVKWPNDIIVRNKKVCGVLIETHRADNQLNVVAGIGLNINQTNFGKLSKAGSLSTESGRNYDTKEILTGILTNLKNHYFLIEQKAWEEIRDNYNSRLFRKDETSKFKLGKTEFQGLIRFVDSSGLLHVELEGKNIKSFKNKEIELIY